MSFVQGTLAAMHDDIEQPTEGKRWQVDIQKLQINMYLYKPPLRTCATRLISNRHHKGKHQSLLEPNKNPKNISNDQCKHLIDHPHGKLCLNFLVECVLDSFDRPKLPHKTDTFVI